STSKDLDKIHDNIPAHEPQFFAFVDNMRIGDLGVIVKVVDEQTKENSFDSGDSWMCQYCLHSNAGSSNHCYHCNFRKTGKPHASPQVINPKEFCSPATKGSITSRGREPRSKTEKEINALAESEHDNVHGQTSPRNLSSVYKNKCEVKEPVKRVARV